MSVYVPPYTGSSSTSCNSSCLYEKKHDYIGSYLSAHALSTPSHRYAYLMWFVIVGFLLVASALHHIGVGEKTWIGAFWGRFAPKARLFKVGQKPISSDSADRRGPNGQVKQRPSIVSQRREQESTSFFFSFFKPSRRFVLTFPSFGKAFLVALMVAIPVVLTLVGADYIAPSASMFDMSESWPSAHESGTYTRRDAVVLDKRVEWGIGSYPAVGTTAPTVSLPYHNWWTSGGRTGLLTNALTPLVTILALKQVPWAVMSTKLFGRHSFEKLSFMHKWGGRLLWVYATAHTVTWSVQLFKDKEFNVSVYEFVWIWPKFRWAWVSYGFLTLMVLLSVGPIRANYYEWFYIGHIICGVGFMVAAALHHPPLGPWMWASLAWWGLERLTRALKVAYINGIGFAGRKQEIVAGTSTADSAMSTTKLVQSSQQDLRQTPQPTFHHRNPFEKLSAQAPPPRTGGHAQSDSLSTLIDPLSYHGHSTTDAKRVSPNDDDKRHPMQSSSDDEWEVNEYGEHAKKTQSRRYGPVSDFLKEYTGRPMTGIQEHSAYVDGQDSEAGSPDLSRQSRFNSTASFSSAHHQHKPSADIGLQRHNVHEIDVDPLTPGNVTPPDAESTLPTSSADHYAAGTYDSTTSTPARPFLAKRGLSASGVQVDASALRRKSIIPADVAALIKPGYAFCQILPGKTLRLTLRTPNKMSWSPGQWVYLNIPSINGWQSHPFTIASAYDADMALPPRRARGDDIEKSIGDKSGGQGEERTIVLLIRVRKGFTLKLWNHVRQHRHQQVLAAAQSTGFDSRGTNSKRTTGVHLRAIVDGAYGSTERVRWAIHSTVMIVCGGSGVSFGLSALEHLCACLQEQNQYGETQRGGKNFQVKKVCFIWICREFSHLQWAASALRRCIEMVPPEQLRIGLYVTHFNDRQMAGAAGQHNKTMTMSTFGSMGNMAGMFNRPAMASSSSFNALAGAGSGWKDGQGNVVEASNELQAGPEAAELQMEVNDFTEFDGEEALQPGAAEIEINNRIRKEGQLRRAHTRKRTLRRRGGAGAEGSALTRGNRSERKETQVMLAQRAMYEGKVPTHVDERSVAALDTLDSGHSTPLRKKRSASMLSGLLASTRKNRPTLAAMGVGSSSSSHASDMYGRRGSAGLQTLSDHGMMSGTTSPGDWTPTGLGEPSSMPASDYYPPPPPRPHFQGVSYADDSRRGSGGSEVLGGGGGSGGTDTPDTLVSYPPSFQSHGMPMASHSRANLLHHGGTGMSQGYQSSYNLHESVANPTSAAAAAGEAGIDDDADCAIDLDAEEEFDLRVIAELAISGHPRLDQLIGNECGRSQGRVLVASCGPSNLAALLRRIAAKNIDPSAVRKGQLNKHVNLCIESFEWGGSG